MQESDNYELFTLAFKQTSESIVITDHDKDDEPITYVNPAFERLTGYRSEEVLGRNCRFMQGEDQQEGVRTQIRKSLRAGHSDVVILQNYRKDGTAFWNELSLSPLHIDGEKLSHYIGVSRDASHHVADKLQLQKSHRKLEKTLAELSELVITDPLTGIHNRRHYNAIMEREWSICRRSESPICLVLVDIDHFKSYNDTHGHTEGDECLVRITKFLSEKFNRGGDLVARFGGEEFVVLCPRMELEKIVDYTRKVCAEINNLQIAAGKDADNPHVSVSAGVACMTPNSNNSQSALFELADERLYAAKQAGRNRVNSGDY